MDYRAMAQLARDPKAVRKAAEGIKERLKDRLSEKQIGFLTRIVNTGVLPSRYWEMFNDLQSRSTRRQIAGRYRASELVQKLWEGRDPFLDNDDDEVIAFLERMRRFGYELAPTRDEWLFIFALCRKVDLLQDEWVDLN